MRASNKIVINLTLVSKHKFTHDLKHCQKRAQTKDIYSTVK